MGYEFGMIRSYLVCLCLVFPSLRVLAQQQAIPTAPASAIPISADNHITLDVVVNDKSGAPVAGLQQNDFTILDNKQPQKILGFQAAGETSSADAAVEIILIVDAVNTSVSAVGYERDQITKFLRQDDGKLARPLSIGLLTDSGFNLQPAASRDGNAIAASLAQHETGLRSITRSQGFYGAADRQQLSLRSLGQLAQYEEKRPGRKIVIWISPGWALLSGPRIDLSKKDQQGIFNMIVEVSTQLRRSSIALYSVDPLGTTDAGGFRTFEYQQYLKAVTAPRQVQLGDLALQVLAVQSGGRVLNSNNDITAEIERCVRDANAYYVLSYDAPPADDPNEYHAVQVKLARPDLKAQTSSGYYAQPVRPRTAR